MPQGILEGRLASAIFAGFKGKLLKGTLRREVNAESAGLNDLGDPIAMSPITFKCEGYVDSKTDRFLKTAGIPHLDATVYVFAKSLVPATEPQKRDQVLMGGQWYDVHAIQNDPATAMHALGCSEIQDPTL